jgi:hypothetical protein
MNTKYSKMNNHRSDKGSAHRYPVKRKAGCGGKRKGAGRPRREGWTKAGFWIRQETLDKLRAYCAQRVFTQADWIDSAINALLP